MNRVECVYASGILMYCNLHSKHTDLTKTQTKPTYKKSTTDTIYWSINDNRREVQLPQTPVNETNLLKILETCLQSVETVESHVDPTTYDSHYMIFMSS